MFPKGDSYDRDNNDATTSVDNEREFYEADLLSNNNSQIGKW